MGLKSSKSGEENREEGDSGDTDDESEILEILQEGDVDEDRSEAQEGSCDLEQRCKKGKSYHDKYIPIKELNLSHLEEPIRHDSVLEYIQLRAELVVKITVRYTSMDRPAGKREKFADLRGKSVSRVATGYAWIYSQGQTHTKCPVSSCAEGPQPHNVYRGILITTNQHVVFNKEEAEAATVEFFYDGYDEVSKKNIMEGRGISLLEEMERKDYISLKIYHHNATLFKRINKVNEKIMKQWEKIPDEIKLQLQNHAIVVSHPHGSSKKVSIGKLCDIEVLEKGKNRKETRYTCQTCEGSSGAPVITGLYWTKPFVHSSTTENKKKGTYMGLSFTY